MSFDIVVQLLFSGLSVGSIYALVALSLVIPFKASGILNFGQGEMLLLGAYVALALSLAGLPYWLVMVLTLLISAALGAVIERVLMRPLVNAPEFTIVIGTYAIGLIIKYAMRLYWQDDVYRLPVPFSSQPWVIGTLRINPVYAWMLVVALLITAALALFFQRSRLGKAMRAVSQNQQASRLMGIGVERIFSATFALSTALGALVGILFAPVAGIHPELGNVILKAFVAAVIGGFTSLPGAVVGGLLLGVVETFAGAFFGSTLRNVGAFAILILILLVRPNGLFGTIESRRV